jgi:cytochrome c oxidase cbb3-type subunit 3
MKKLPIIAALLTVSALAACGPDETAQKKQPRPPDQQQAKSDQSAVNSNPEVALVDIAPGGEPPVRQKSPEAAKFDGNADQIAAGRQLYVAFNCVGCHFNGGGGMGPALMDKRWLYGSSMENIASTIREGRPNGMPSFRAMVGDDQVWQLAAYVRSLSGLGAKGAQANNEPGQ